MKEERKFRKQFIELSPEERQAFNEYHLIHKKNDIYREQGQTVERLELEEDEAYKVCVEAGMLPEEINDFLARREDQED